MKDDPLKFTLAAETPGGDDLIIQAMTPEDKEKWIKEIKANIKQKADMLRGKGYHCRYQGMVEVNAYWYKVWHCVFA